MILEKIFRGRAHSFVLIGFMLIIISGILVSGFGVGFESNKLKLYPGEVLDSSFILQNYQDNAGVLNIEVNIEEGTDYMSLTNGNVFEVPVQSSIIAPVKVSVPQDAKIGDVYKVKVLFRASGGEAEKESGKNTAVGFLFSQRRNIDIEVVPKPAPAEPEAPASQPTSTANNAVWWWILGIVVLIIIIWMIVRARKK